MLELACGSLCNCLPPCRWWKTTLRITHRLWQQLATINTMCNVLSNLTIPRGSRRRCWVINAPCSDGVRPSAVAMFARQPLPSFLRCRPRSLVRSPIPVFHNFSVQHRKFGMGLGSRLVLYIYPYPVPVPGFDIRGPRPQARARRGAAPMPRARMEQHGIRPFTLALCTFSAIMMGDCQVIDGKALAAEIRSKVAVEIFELKKTYPGFQPQLSIIQVDTSMHVLCIPRPKRAW